MLIKTWSASILLLNGVLGDHVRHPARGAPNQPGNLQSFRYSNTTTSITSITSRATTSTCTTSTTSSSSAVSCETSSTTSDFSRTSCLANSTATYFHTVYPTVYLTVTEEYTPSGFHAYGTPRETYVTPPPACHSTIISPSPGRLTYGTYNPDDPTTSDVASPLLPTSGLSYYPTASPPMTSTSLASYNPTMTGVEIISTVIVTKKTPAPPGQYTTKNPPVSYGPPDTWFNHGGGGGSSGGNNGGGGGGRGPGSGDGSHGNNGPNSGNRPGSDGGAGGNGNLNNDGSLNRPPTFAVPTIVTVGGQSITIQSTAVIIGPSTIPFPTQSLDQPLTVVQEGRTFTVLPGKIIGPSTTFSIQSTAADSTITQAASVVTADGMVLTIGHSQAILSGTTYRIGIPSNPQTITLNGHTITFNSNGAIFPSTTFHPPMTIAISGDKMFEIVVLDGVIISVDATEAVISGTTYRIGSGAGTSTVVVDGKTITCGPEGVIYGSTTIEPTSLGSTATVSPTTSPSTGAIASNSGPQPTESDSAQNNGGKNMRTNSIASHFLGLLSVFLFAF